MSLATTFTDVANLALKSLGAVLIQNIDANNGHAPLINDVIDEVVRQVQSEISWPELLNVQLLVKLPDNFSNSDSIYRYQLPEDFLSVVEIDSNRHWSIFDGVLLTTAEEVSLIYKAYNPDVTKWSAEMTEMVYKKLASEIAMPVTQDLNSSQLSTQRFEVCRDRLLPQMKNRCRKEQKTLRKFSYLQVRDYTRK
ncbi:MAG: hypothetical protein HRU26_04310 [Psychroserpens sp.]|nr:hypothetical protein [Psychroserpens sp.]